ncbi:hypothetical protein DPMN_026360, partial [Dreissena polymorpha]
DVNGIEMQVIPQTQFIPLPEALCLIIMDLNNGQIVATLDTVCERLKHCYQGIHLPSNQLVYETLGQLIRERKVFHTGCGYFVVTPDTFRMHGDDLQTSGLMSPWTHLHPMYIPAIFSQRSRQPMRSILCQVETEENMIGQGNLYDWKDKRYSVSNDRLQIDKPVPRMQRSMSLSVKRSRDRGRKEDDSESGSLKRGSSANSRNENKGKENKKAEKSKEKFSFFSKLFGRNKKKQSDKAAESKKPVVEYATFSAQFPPPEWLWYQQQVDRQIRTQTWVQQQLAKAGTLSYLQRVSTDSGTSSVMLGPSSMPEKVGGEGKITMGHGGKHVEVEMANKKTKQKSKKNRMPVVIANQPGDTTYIDDDQTNTFRNSCGQKQIKLSSLPTRLMSPSRELLHSEYVSHPAFSSTPRFSSIHEQQEMKDDTFVPKPEIKSVKDEHDKGNKSKSGRKARKSRNKSRAERHSSYFPSRHVSGMSQPLSPHGRSTDNDISFEYQGQLKNKHRAMGLSQSSGVNCVGLTKATHVQSVQHTWEIEEKIHSDRYARSNSYRHPVADKRVDMSALRTGSYRHMPNSAVPSRPGTLSLGQGQGLGQGQSLGQGHIYANVHISEERKPSLPERKHRSHMQDIVNEQVMSRMDRPFSPVASTDSHSDRQEMDRRSEHGSERETLTSNSSQGQSSHDSAIEGTGSEQSLGTVINKRSQSQQEMNAKDMFLGDSGFSSPRVQENTGESKQTDCEARDKRDFMCNNLKEGVSRNNSPVNGKGEDFSDDSFDRISSDKLYENVCLSHREMLNNMKYLHKDINVSSQNLNVPNVSLETSGSSREYDPKQEIMKKFNLEGDFHIVGVV